MPVGVAFRSLMAAGGGAAGPWDVIDSTTLGSGATSVSFASIDPKYKLLRMTAYIVAGNNIIPFVRFNNDSGANYDRQYLRGTSTTVAAARATGQTSLGFTEAILSGANGLYTITVAKQATGSPAMVLASTVVNNSDVTSNYFAGRWNNTADLINRFDLISSSPNNLAAGTVAVLEGLAD